MGVGAGTRGRRRREGGGRNGQIKGRCRKAFFSGPGSCLLEVDVGNMRMWSQLGKPSHSLLFYFFNPGTLSKGFGILHRDVYVINRGSLAPSGCVPKGEFDGDLIPSRGSKVFCTQIPRSTIARGAYLLCCDVDLNLASFSTTAPYLRRSAEVTRGFCGDTQRQGPWLVLKGLPDSTRIYFTYKLNFLFWFRRLLDWGYAWYSTRRLLSRISWRLQKPCGPRGASGGLCSFIPIHLGVHVAAHMCVC